MTSAVNDVAPTVKNVDGLRAFVAKHTDKPVIIYFSGVHANGTNCGACEGFEANNANAMREHSQDVYFVQMEVPLPTSGETPEGAVWNKKSSEVVEDIFSGISNVSLTGTPAMLEIRADANGGLTATRDLKISGTTTNLDEILENLKPKISLQSDAPNPLKDAMEKARIEALAALADRTPTDSTPTSPTWQKKLKDGPVTARG